MGGRPHTPVTRSGLWYCGALCRPIATWWLTRSRSSRRSPSRTSGPARVGARRQSSSTCGIRTSSGRGPSRGPSPSAGASWSSRPRTPSRTQTPLVVYCLSGIRSLLAAKALHDLGYRNVASMAGGVRRWKELRPPADQGRAALDRPDGAVQPPLHAGPGRRAGPEAAAPLEGAPDRRRRARLADGALPGGRRRGHARHHRLGRRRPVQPPAPDPATARSTSGAPRSTPRGIRSKRSTPRRPRRAVRRAADRRQHRAAAQRLRRRRRRLGQLRHPLSRQRRLPPGRQARTSTAPSSSSRGWSPCSRRGAGPAIAASTPSRRRRGWCPS